MAEARLVPTERQCQFGPFGRGLETARHHKIAAAPRFPFRSFRRTMTIMSPRLRWPLLASLIPSLVTAVVAEEESSSQDRPAVTKVGEHRYRLGDIELDARAREVRFPVVVNMREGGPVEYVLVHESGKVHEAIFTTAVSPLHLQVALELLRFEAGKGDVFNRMLPPEALADEGGTREGRGTAVTVRFQPEDSDEEAFDVSRTIIDAERAAPMTPEP